MDVLIIGSGPAGVAAAITIARAGLAVTLISKKRPFVFAGNEPLESVHPGIETLLKSIGAEKALAYSSKGTYTGIISLGVFKPLSINPNETWTGDHISRSLFDSFLMVRAKEQNVTIVDDRIGEIYEDGDHKQVVFISGRKIKCKYIIDASGRTRLLGKMLQFNEAFYSPPLSTWSGVTTNVEELFFKSLVTTFIPYKHGWCWLAPETSGRCTWTRLALSRKGTLAPPPELSRYTNESKIRSSNVRWRIFRPIIKHRVLLTGDAAGSIDPAAGQGILNALFSGIMAAHTVINCINNQNLENKFLAEYDRWFLNHFEQKTKLLKEYYDEHKISLF